jgi:hypothetical protein
MTVEPARKGDHFMFQPKARRTFPVLALTAALFFAPLASLSAETGQEPAGVGLLAQIEAQIESILDALRGTLRDAGPRMDDNG